MTSKRLLLLLLKFPSFLSQKMWNCSRRVSLSICIFFTASLLFFFTPFEKSLLDAFVHSVWKWSELSHLNFGAQKSKYFKLEFFEKSPFFRLFLGRKFKDWNVWIFTQKISVLFGAKNKFKFVCFTENGIFVFFQTLWISLIYSFRSSVFNPFF